MAFDLNETEVVSDFGARSKLVTPWTKRCSNMQNDIRVNDLMLRSSLGKGPYLMCSHIENTRHR